MRDHASLAFLFRQLLARDLSARYKSSALGLAWVILQPLLMLAIYTVVFGGIFKVRWADAGHTTADFALILFAGLIVFSFFSDVLTSTHSLVSSQPAYVKKVVFPVALLGAVRVAGAAVPALASLLLLFAASWWTTRNGPPASFVLAPLVLFAMSPLVLGTAWLVSGFGVYIPDIGQLASLLASVLLFVSPLFFPVESLPQGMGWLAAVNPLVVPIEELRALTLGSGDANGVRLALYFGGSCVFALLSYRIFRRLSRGFADVL